MEINYLDWMEFAFLLCLTPLLRIKNKLDIWVIYAWVYTTWISSFYLFYSDYKPKFVVGIWEQQYRFLVLLLLFVLFMKAKINTHKLRNALGYVGIFNYILTIALYFLHEPWITGLIPNKGLNGILNIMLFPYAISISPFSNPYRPWFLLPVFLLPICTYFSHSSCAVLAFVTLGIGYLLTSYNPKKWLYASVFCFGVIAAAYFLVPGLLDPGDRFTRYHQFFSGFTPRDWLIGRGTSSFLGFSASLQKATAQLNVEPYYYSYMHSDPLQYIYEFGAIGLVPLLISGIWVFKHAQRREFLVLVSAIAGGLFYYPFRQYPHLLIFLIVLKTIVDNEKNKSKNKTIPNQENIKF